MTKSRGKCSSGGDHEESALLFGKGTLPVVLPDSVQATVLRKPVMPLCQDPVREVEKALNTPEGNLRRLAASAASACIVICDITRPVPNGLVLPPLIRALLEGGMARQNITVLVATGLHRPNLGEELRELVGSDWVLQTVDVQNHYATKREDHTFLGKTARGTPVGIDRRFVEADLKIVLGLVEPHFMAGYSGGRKIIAPGIAHEDTIRTFHNTDFMEHPLARSCRIPGNPLHEEQLEIVRMMGSVHAINTVLDEERRLSFVNFGEVLSSHADAVEFVRRYAEVEVPRQYPLVISGAAGYPLDKTYYQAIKGIVSAMAVTAPGGVLLMASECAEGVGSKEFEKAQTRLVEGGVDVFLKEARGRRLAAIDEWQSVKLAQVLRHARIHFYTPCLNAGQQRLTGLTCHDNWQQALETALAESGAREVAVIPEGPYVTPLVNSSPHP